MTGNPSTPSPSSEVDIPIEHRFALAGALAELGIVKLMLTAPGQPPHVLAAREADLPGILIALREGDALEAHELLSILPRQHLQPHQHALRVRAHHPPHQSWPELYTRLLQFSHANGR